MFDDGIGNNNVFYSMEGSTHTIMIIFSSENNLYFMLQTSKSKFMKTY